jgi:nucleoid DNA-binding protein
MANTGKRMTRAQIINELAERSELSKKQISNVFEHLQHLIKRELGRRGPGEFVIPDMIKLKVRKTPMKKDAQVRIPGPPGSEPKFVIKDIPAQKKLRATPLKKLKDLVLQG